MRDEVISTLLTCLEHMALDWSDHRTAREVASSSDCLTILRVVQDLVDDRSIDLDAKLVCEEAPAFADWFCKVDPYLSKGL